MDLSLLFSCAGTLDAAALREFFSYNINTKATIDDCLMLIQYYNGMAGRLAFTISMADLIKEMKLLALSKHSAFSPPSAENYDKWVKHIEQLDNDMLIERRDMRIAKKSLDMLEEDSVTERGGDDDDDTVSSLGHSVFSAASQNGGFQINQAYKHRIRAGIQHTLTADSKQPTVKMIVRRQSSVHSPGSVTSTASPTSHTVEGVLGSIKYNAASPHMYSVQASHDVAKMRKQIEKEAREKEYATVTIGVPVRDVNGRSQGPASLEHSSSEGGKTCMCACNVNVTFSN
jgi:hypothetical protein